VTRTVLALLLSALFAAGCSSSRTAGGGPTEMAIADDAAPAQGGVARCERRLGTVAITEADVNAQALLSAGLPRSLAPLMRHLLLRSTCFTVVDRGAAFALLDQERRLREQLGGEELGSPRRMQPVDYVMRAEIVFAEQTAGGKGLLGGVFGNVIGGIGGEVQRKEAVVLLSVVDARTSEIISSVFGRGSSESAGLGSMVLTSGFGTIEGGWSGTPQARTVAAALVDAWNRTQPRLAVEVAAPAVKALKPVLPLAASPPASAAAPPAAASVPLAGASVPAAPASAASASEPATSPASEPTR
jgi:curli biogenesis system outer membrane secretion channel CsgG